MNLNLNRIPPVELNTNKVPMDLIPGEEIICVIVKDFQSQQRLHRYKPLHYLSLRLLTALHVFNVSFRGLKITNVHSIHSLTEC